MSFSSQISISISIRLVLGEAKILIKLYISDIRLNVQVASNSLMLLDGLPILQYFTSE